MTRRALLLVAALCPAGALLTPVSAAPTPALLPSEATVLVKDSFFESKTIVLQLSRQGTAVVRWKWDTGSTRPHNVQSDTGAYNSHPGCGDAGPSGIGGFERCGFTAVTTYTQTFRKAGTYRYHCRIHGGPGQAMAGTVVVKAAPAARRR